MHGEAGQDLCRAFLVTHQLAQRGVAPLPLRLLRDRQQFHGLFIVSPQPFENFDQRAVRTRGEHILRRFIGLEEYRHDQRGELSLSGHLTQRAVDRLHAVVRRTLGVQQGHGAHGADVDYL
ncbi:hypothetical protein [Streptomyces sp. TE5632]